MARPVKKSGIHAHGCTTCHGRYEDGCATPDTEGECFKCRCGSRWEELYENRMPKDCCTTEGRSVTKQERLVYRLSNSRDWWICPTCYRTHPHNPRRDQQ